jgi:hypothetical protein
VTRNLGRPPTSHLRWVRRPLALCAHDAPMTTTSLGPRGSDLTRRNAGAAHRTVRFATALIVCGGLVGACASTSSGNGTTTPTSPSAATTSASASGTGVTSTGSTGSGCAQVQAAGAALSDTWQQYTAGKAALSEVVASVEGLAGAVESTAASAGPTLRAQVEQLQAAVQSFAATLKTSPPPSREQLQTAAQRVLDALKAVRGPCASLRQ